MNYGGSHKAKLDAAGCSEYLDVVGWQIWGIESDKE
jgi:hypothetical protein